MYTADFLVPIGFKPARSWDGDASTGHPPSPCQTAHDGGIEKEHALETRRDLAPPAQAPQRAGAGTALRGFLAWI